MISHFPETKGSHSENTALLDKCCKAIKKENTEKKKSQEIM